VSVFGSLSFWVIFAVVFAVGLAVIVRHARANQHRRPTQNRGVQPHEQAKLIIADLGADGFDNNVNHAYHVTTDPQAYAKAFVPSDHKD
jgi:hypothetical protein